MCKLVIGLLTKMCQLISGRVIPVNGQKPDFESMETIISAIKKMVIKDVVLYVESKKKELNKLTENANA